MSFRLARPGALSGVGKQTVIKGHEPISRMIKAGEYPAKRGLTAATLADDRQNLAPAHGHANTIDGAQGGLLAKAPWPVVPADMMRDQDVAAHEWFSG